MAKFKGELTFKVSFNNLNIPVLGQRITNRIIYHKCATQIGLRTPWTKIDRKYLDKNFKVKLTDVIIKPGDEL